MKKFIIAAALTVVIAANASAASLNTDKSIISTAFTAAYPGATQVHYKTVGELYSITFDLNNAHMEAFYNAEGEKVAVSKVISFNTLSMKAQETIQNNYSQYVVTEVIEMNDLAEGATSYYVSMLNDTHKIIAKVSAFNEVTTFKKTKR